jgi:hypothetical protein
MRIQHRLAIRVDDGAARYRASQARTSRLMNSISSGLAIGLPARWRSGHNAPANLRDPQHPRTTRRDPDNQNRFPPFGTRRSGRTSTTAPSSSGIPSTRTSLMNGPIWRGGKFTTAQTCRPSNWSVL